ncbi:MAG TPA: hypothetical protein VGD13_13385, partial [Xanthobacteraceae bacterium]
MASGFGLPATGPEGTDSSRQRCGSVGGSTMNHPIAHPRVKNALVRRFWRSARGFWSGNQRRIAWLMTITVIALVVVQLVIQYRINVWNREIFDALEKKDGSA